MVWCAGRIYSSSGSVWCNAVGGWRGDGGVAVLLASATESKNQMQCRAALEVVLRSGLVVAPVRQAKISSIVLNVFASDA